MVEFGLKLEDNKVAEWKDKYVRYDRLKAVLDRAKKLVVKLESLRGKYPELTARVEAAYRSDNQDELDFLRSSRSASPSGAAIAAGAATTTEVGASTKKDDDNNNNNNNDLRVRLALQPPTSCAVGTRTQSTDGRGGGASTSRAEIETTSLRSEEDSSLSSSLLGGGGPHLKRTESSGTLLHYLAERAASGVSDFFERQAARQIRDALAAMDSCSSDFEALLTEDVVMVNSFYDEKLRDIQGRLQLLKESVAVSFFNLPVPPPPPPPTEDSPGTGGSRHAALAMQQQSSNVSEGSASFMDTPLIDNVQRKHPPSSIVVAVHRGLLALQMRRPSNQLQQREQQQQQRHRKQRSSSSAVELGESQPLLPVGEDDDDDDNATANSTKGSTSVAAAPEDAASALEAQSKAREAESVQRSLIDLYRRSKLLHNYAIMNYTGFVKIVKKHDKTLTEHKGKYKKLIAPSNVCHEGGKDVEKLGDSIERLYANWFCGRSVTEARAQLLPKQGDGLEMDWSQLRLGYRMGMCSVLALWVAWDCIWGTIKNGTSTIGGRTAFPVFRACGGLLLLQWFWGCSLWVWTRYRVNYIYLFDLNPHLVSTPLGIFNEAVDNSLVFLIGMLLYYKAGSNDLPIDFPAGILPFLLVLYTAVQLVYPWRIRRSMWHSIRLVVTTPMTSPTFFHGYIGDIFTSMVKVFQDIAWTVAFIASGDFMIPEELPASTKHRWARSTWYSKVLIPLITLLPLWFRFNQCLRRYADTSTRVPHLPNAGKYALSMTVTLFGAFHPLYLHTTSNQPSDLFQIFWMCTFVSSSLYSFFWDVRMDWGLGRIQYQLLGPRLMYPNRTSYYVVMVIDLVLRFAWVLTLVPPNSGAKFALPQYLTAVSMIMELFRRTLWGFFRLENEHRSNTSGYRRVDFVPLHFSTQHTHAYKGESAHRGGNVLVEVAVVTLVVLGAAVASVVAAQHETERLMASNGEL